MLSRTFGTALGIAFVAVTGGAAWSQESHAGADDADAAPRALEKCFNVAGFTDMTVLSDRHVYVRTRGSNHYLLTTEQCDGLQRSYRYETFRFVSPGRRVCENDGAYFLYDARGREATCPLVLIQRVRNREEARLFADEGPPPVDIVEIDDIGAIDDIGGIGDIEEIDAPDSGEPPAVPAPR
jgi:Family of unknown function (DUF6491)